MITPPTPFRYFLDPHHFSNYSDSGEVCPFCGLVRPGYGGGFSWAAEYDGYDEHHGFICEVCLKDGKLPQKGFFIEEGAKLRLDIRFRHPELSEAEVETLALRRASEVEQRTPRIKGLSLSLWATHCGDFCCFIKEAGQLDMHRLAPDGDGRAFLESLLIGGGGYLWEMVRPDAPEDNSVEHHVGIYLFRCLECGKYRVGYRLGV